MDVAGRTVTRTCVLFGALLAVGCVLRQEHACGGLHAGPVLLAFRLSTDAVRPVQSRDAPVCGLAVTDRRTHVVGEKHTRVAAQPLRLDRTGAVFHVSRDLLPIVLCAQTAMHDRPFRL